MAAMEMLEKPYFYQVPIQKPASGPLVLDKGNIAPGVPIVVSAVSSTTQEGDTITLFFNGVKLGKPFVVIDPNELVYDLLVLLDDWPEGIGDTYITVSRKGTVVGKSQSLNLRVKNDAKTTDVQRREGLLVGLYGPGIVDSWLVPGTYSYEKGAQILLSMLPIGKNSQGAVLKLMRWTDSSLGGVYDELCMWTYQNGSWAGGVFDQGFKLVRGDHLFLYVVGTQPVNLTLEYAI
ncbi:hypothetical protein [Pseudomonas sp. PDM25]|uniref:hypothetical protein n=1 Tax=Pseudomonas sp. PDM25 TaxID=2854772 RepID=UPI001C448297|nr:hypothetical protein [Pseudomonas sp. PDM25]MBV7515709.1 hypothetical protein [Pseudomonas sp. PDM25]